MGKSEPRPEERGIILEEVLCPSQNADLNYPALKDQVFFILNKCFFTLFEIVLCIAILSMISAVLGWQIKSMVTAHYFHKNVDNLLTDLRKMQIIALSNRIDIEMQITKEKGQYSYRIHSDEPISFFMPKCSKLIGVKKITVGSVPKDQLKLHVYPSGRIEPKEKILFFQHSNQKKALSFDLNSESRPEGRGIILEAALCPSQNAE